MKNLTIAFGLLVCLGSVHAFADEQVAHCVAPDSDGTTDAYDVSKTDAGTYAVTISAGTVKATFSATKAEFSADGNNLTIEAAPVLAMKISKLPHQSLVAVNNGTDPVEATCTTNW